ncbi:hypothetical protein ACSBR1_037969 [Camellia fascicularis]
MGRCWNNCNCGKFRSYKDGTGCVLWTVKLSYQENPRSPITYLPVQRNSYSYRGEKEMKNLYIEKLIASRSYDNANGVENDEVEDHDLKMLSFASIADATNNFSNENKLGADPTKRKLLDWKKRLNIIEGVAHGLLYLHRYSRMIVTHRDLKASNVLASFGKWLFFRLFGYLAILVEDETEAITNKVVGTYSYISPEYIVEGNFSVKYDVLSFRVLIMEIVSGRRNSTFYHLDCPRNLIGYAWELWKKETALESKDLTLGDSCPVQKLLITIHVGLLCVQENALDRPIMSNVISMLSNGTFPLSAPKKLGFFNEKNMFETTSHHQVNLGDCSTNKLSISTLEAL